MTWHGHGQVTWNIFIIEMYWILRGREETFISYLVPLLKLQIQKARFGPFWVLFGQSSLLPRTCILVCSLPWNIIIIKKIVPAQMPAMHWVDKAIESWSEMLANSCTYRSQSACHNTASQEQWQSFVWVTWIHTQRQKKGVIFIHSLQAQPTLFRHNKLNILVKMQTFHLEKLILTH